MINREPFSLTGEIALVTGATGTLGQAIVKDLLHSGASVAIHHFNQGEAAEKMAAAHRTDGYSVCTVSGDVSSPEDAQRMLEQAEQALGPVSILVNNAGIMDERPFVDTPLAVWNETIAVDLTGVFIMCQEAVRRMNGRGRGFIVNIASQTPFKGGPNIAPYSAAKAGVVGLTRALAREVGPAIRVNAIAPGPLSTAMTEPYAAADHDWVQKRVSGLVDKRMGDVSDVSPTVVFLASNAGALFHGQTLHVNGGGVML
jgi:3-oxoacyl-[acyl-carrier protein] reductase